MQKLTAVEAAQILGVNERTVRNWLKKGRFPGAKRVYIKGLHQWAIPMSDIEAVKREEEEITGQTGIIPELEARIAKLEAQVSDLIARSTGQTGVTGGGATQKTGTTPEQKPLAMGATLPEGYISFVDFYTSHNIPETSAGRWRKHQPDRATSGNWHDEKGHLVRYALSPDQQHLFYRDLHEHQSFKQCSNCPHKWLT